MMTPFQNASIRQKLMVIIMATSTVALLVASGFFILNDVVTMREAKVNDLAALAQVVGANCTAAISFQDDRAAAQTLTALRAKPRIVGARIFTADGKVFATYARSGSPERPGSPDLQLIAQPPPAGQRYVERDLVLGRPIVLDGERLGSIAILSDTDDIDARIRNYVRIVLLVLVVALCVAYVVSSRLQRVISEPVLGLANTAKTVSVSRDFSIRASKKGSDEIGFLIDQFNEMLGQIGKQEADLQAVNQQLARSEQEALAANHAKSQFLANMSHELRTPLNAVIGFSEVLADQTFGELNPRQSRYVNNILTSGRHLLQLINDILDLAKVEAGRLELELSEFAPDSALRDVEAIAKALANKKQVTLRLEPDPDLPTLTADQAKFKQIMYNLLSNAIKYTREGGAVRVKAALTTVAKTGRGLEATLSPLSPLLQVSVIDNGIGIKPEDQERVFGEFEQLDASYARQQQGTGLGLALTRKLVELHGGRIWVESQGEEQGSVFHFVLPLGGQDAAASLAGQEAPADAGPRATVLVVEDNREASELLRHYLEEAGYEVAQAFDAESALRLARELKPYAITLDVIIQKKDAWGLLANLKSDAATRDIPVVIVSMTEDRRLGLALGAVDFLVKPVSRDRLVEAVARAGASARRTPCTVLVVDDDPTTVELLVSLLQPQGYQVLRAFGGRAGIDTAIAELPDVIVLDLLMPEVTGFDVVQALRDHPKARDIPILVFTAKEITEDDQRRLSRVQALVSKSSRDDLMRALERSGCSA